MTTAVAVRFALWVVRHVRMLTMGLVDVPMFVLKRLVTMFVFVPFHEVQVKTDAYEDGSDGELEIHGLRKHDDGQ